VCVCVCVSRDVMCGKLFCQGGNDNPNYGRMVSFSGCKASFFADYTADYGQVDAGTKCADGKVRLSAEIHSPQHFGHLSFIIKTGT